MSIYENTTFKPGEVGIIEGLDYETYRKAPGLAGSDLQTIEESPAKYKRGDRLEETEEMAFGTLFHSYLLTHTAAWHVRPETYFDEKEKIDKKWIGSSGVCKKWLAEHTDKPVLRAEGSLSAALLKTMVMKTRAHPMAALLLSQLKPEVSVFARHEDCGTLCKGRLDGLIRGERTIIVEVKTTRDASTKAFSREILNRGYHRKAAWYKMLLHQMRVSPVEFWFIAVENNGQCRVNVRRLADRAMDEKGDMDNSYSFDLFTKCKRADFWPEFADSQFPGETAETPFIDLPPFMYPEEELSGLTAAEDEAS